MNVNKKGGAKNNFRRSIKTVDYDMAVTVAYQFLSQVYDQMEGDRFSVRMVQYAFDLMRRLKYRPARVLDLCCGTGTAAILMAECGLEVSGLDGSKEMLKVARRKFRERDHDIKLYQQVMPEIELPQMNGKFDLVTSFYDSLNYLTLKNDLYRTFRKVQQLLKPGGYFIFDMNTPWALENIWTQTYAGDRKDIAWIWNGKYTPAKKTAELKTTMFLRKGNSWKRYDEIHIERGYENGELEEMLKRAGFEIDILFECFKFEKPNEKSPRVAFAARKI